MKQVLMAAGRGLIYSLVFWLVYSVLYHPPWQRQSSTDRDDARTEAYWKGTEEQQVKSEKMFQVAEQQYKRMDALMSKQEELSQRFEAVIARWEKQVGIKH
ncbi:MAG TPA: hypothetical protein VGK37_17255 [Casimicrobiaceae bacterium]|jgi:hypothetical protein